jgi:hypothetical protein
VQSFEFVVEGLLKQKLNVGGNEPSHVTAAVPLVEHSVEGKKRLKIFKLSMGANEIVEFRTFYRYSSYKSAKTEEWGVAERKKLNMFQFQ